MTTFFFFVSDLFHQLLFYFGTVFAMLVLFIEKISKPLKKSWFVGAAITCLFIACYQCWLDEHHNTETIIQEKALQVGMKNTCLSDLRVETAFSKGQESLNGSQRQALDRQQDTMEKQQSAVNNCVVSLGKMNPVVRREVHVIVIPFGVTTKNSTAFISRFAANPNKVYMEEVVIATNEDEQRPSGYLHCTEPFEIAGNPELPMISSGMVASEPATRISDREYHIAVSNTGSHWGPSTPMYMPIRSDMEILAGCSFTPQ
jgi:hypothetical protein